MKTLDKIILKILLIGVLIPIMQIHASDESPNEKILHGLIQEFINTMQEQYGLSCVGSGGKTHDKIEKINIMLETNRRASIDEARQIQVDIQEKLLEMINNKKEIQSFLSKIPFKREHLSISISYVNRLGTWHNDNSIATSGCTGNRIYYNKSEIFKPRLILLHEEPFDEAQKIVKEHPLAYDVRQHKEVGYEKELDKLSVEFARNAHKKFGIFCESFGCNFSDAINQISFALVRKKSTPLVKARKYEVELTQMLLDMINKNESLRPFLCQYPFTAKQTAIRIQSIHGKGVLFQDGSISRVMQNEGTISYFKEKAPTQYTPIHTEADLILQESFEEAQKNLKKRR